MAQCLHFLLNMGLIELLTIPAITLIAIIVVSAWSDFSVGALAITALAIALLLAVVSTLLRCTWNVEEDERVYRETVESFH